MDLSKKAKFLKLRRLVGDSDTLAFEEINYHSCVKIVLTGTEYRSFVWVRKTEPAETRVKLGQALDRLCAAYAYEKQIFLEAC